MDKTVLIEECFKLGLKYSEILKCLETLHRYMFVINLRTLKRITRNLGHYRRKQKSDIVHIVHICGERQIKGIVHVGQTLRHHLHYDVITRNYIVYYMSKK